MPRPKRKLVLPEVIHFNREDGTPIIVELISEETESYGLGSAKKVQNFRDFELGFNHFANVLFADYSSSKKDLEKLINKKVSLVGITRELQLKGIELEERAMRDLAKRIKYAIKAYFLALKEIG